MVTVAPEGTIWICQACGKGGYDRKEVGDESCYLDALLCKDKDLVWIAGTVKIAVAITNETYLQGRPR